MSSSATHDVGAESAAPSSTSATPSAGTGGARAHLRSSLAGRELDVQMAMLSPPARAEQAVDDVNPKVERAAPDEAGPPRRVQRKISREGPVQRSAASGGSEIETNLDQHWYATNSFNQNHSQVLGYDLPFGTAFKKFLVGTQSYAVMAALQNLPEPDYILPDGFLNPDGDTVVWWFYQTIVIPPGVMPQDGFRSIRVVNPTIPTYAVETNSPTNFAGETGTIPLAVPSQSDHTLALLAPLLLAAAWLARRALRPTAGARRTAPR